MIKKTYTAIALLVLTLSAIAPPALADDVIIGIVVSIADGDTIAVLEGQTQHRIRLCGIDVYTNFNFHFKNLHFLRGGE